MKQTLIILITFISTVCMLIGQSKYSGIYSSSAYVLNETITTHFSITAGGRVFDGDEDASNTNPYKSIVSSNGKVNAVSYDRLITAVGSISSNYSFKGTIKSGGLTVRVSGKRVLK